MASKEISNWADDFMFRSESHNAADGPKVHLLSMNADPLASVAACAKMYKGEVVRDLSDVTHEERKYYLEQMQLTKLKMPLESVNFHFMFENVTRAFTHQLVRQRTAAYAQESMRFAVVEDMNQAVALPPSLAQFSVQNHAGQTRGDVLWESYRFHGEDGYPRNELSKQDYRDRMGPAEKQYVLWRESVELISDNYNQLVNSGMPAEDARGLMPTNIITRVNYITNLRGLLDHAGNRLCTQAQFEWRLVFNEIAKAIRNYQPHGSRIKSMGRNADGYELSFLGHLDASDGWQFEAIADLLKPVCYQTGSCAFGAEFDRKCSIRPRVQANAEINRPSAEWDEPWQNGETGQGRIEDKVLRNNLRQPVFIGAISPMEWAADPAAAR